MSGKRIRSVPREMKQRSLIEEEENKEPFTPIVLKAAVRKKGFHLYKH